MLSRFVVSQVKHNSYFLIGTVVGLWLALVLVPLNDEPVMACPSAEPSLADEFEPHLEERPLGVAGPSAGRTVQRPRYYHTELGIRGGVMAGVLTSSSALEGRAAAINATARRLRPLRLFVAAPGASAPRPNVVAFTDAREILKPFHALKYLADNYLEEYDFFFLVSDTSYINARRLQELVSKLSVSQDIYMGTVAEDDSHYCTLEGGILLSNSVVRAVHSELDWCVRNSYSAHHHENIGRCILHATHLPCHRFARGEVYISAVLREGREEVWPDLADAVTAHPVSDPAHFYRLHAYVSRVYLERGLNTTRSVGVEVWPSGLRRDPTRPPTPPSTRFDHPRWTSFNASHAFMPDDHRSVAAIRGAHRQALDMVVKAAVAWARKRDGGDDTANGGPLTLESGAWLWEPALGLRYRLWLQNQVSKRWVGVEIFRPLGAARLVPAPYVTESARLTLIVPVPARQRAIITARAFLRRYETVAIKQDNNTALVVVVVKEHGETNTTVLDQITAVARKLPGEIRVVEATLPTGEAIVEIDDDRSEDSYRYAALLAALKLAPAHALLLTLSVEAEFTQDFLNRARMGTVQGVQWQWTGAFTRSAVGARPTASGTRPHHHTGRFDLHRSAALSVYKSDLEHALSEWQGAPHSIAAVLAATSLRCLRAPDPALLKAPPTPPDCLFQAETGKQIQSCQRASLHLPLGDRQALARLLLEAQAATENAQAA
ncbi:hypothetical protein ACJJTC_000626 [Scirpophaga incertulas]